MKKIVSTVFILAFAVYIVSRRWAGIDQLPTTEAKAPRSASTTSTLLVAKAVSKYKDGTFTGNNADAYYGNVRVAVIIKGGKISDVVFQDYPKDRSTSKLISSFAMPKLKSEVIKAQKGPVNIVSGATEISKAFNQSLVSALSQAKK